MQKKKLWLGELWDEWLTNEIKSKSNAEYEVSGILMGMKNFTTNRLKTARRLMKIWPFTSYSKNFSPAISMTTRKNYKPSVTFSFPYSLKILKPPKNLQTSWAWLKGIWGSAGGLYFPKNGYYLTLIISDKDVSQITKGVLELTGLSWSEHRNEFTLRNHEDIMTFLCNAGMPSGALNFDETVIIRSVRNRANLQSNYETANIARTVKAARKQLELAKKILNEGIFESLPKNLRDVIECRLKNPEYSLDELGKNLLPPISKSAVKYRWVKIQNYIEAKN